MTQPPPTTSEALAVEYYGRTANGYGNIIWGGAWPMRGGKFPKPHPCAGNPQPTVFANPETHGDDPLGRFRARGYFASCFPEGDGIAFDPPAGRTVVEIIRDIEECFGFRVEVKRV